MLMGKGAEEIQELWQPVGGDLFFTSCTSLSSAYGGRYSRNMMEEFEVKDLPMPDLNNGKVYTLMGLEPNSNYLKWSSDCFPEPDEREFLKRFVWILRQDQSQEVISFDLHELAGLPMRLSEILEEIGTSDFFYCRTMEQLWFALVMQEKYSKIWDLNSKKWVTTN